MHTLLSVLIAAVPSSATLPIKVKYYMSILVVFLFIAMLATFIVMAAGIALMARGGEANTKYGNKLMQWRVWLQGISLALLAALFAMKE